MAATSAPTATTRDSGSINKAAERDKPFARRTAQLRSALIQRVTREDMAAIADAVILKARNGDLAAIKEIVGGFQQTVHTVPPGILTPVVRIVMTLCVRQLSTLVITKPHRQQTD
jgi:hypothetical protein